MLGFKYIPPIGAITPIGMQILGILFGAIFAYCTVGMIWPSIFALILLGLVDGYSVIGVFKESFGHTVVLYMFSLLIFGSILESSGLTELFSKWLISRKIAVGKPWILSGLILFAAFFCGLFIGMIPPTIICWSIVYGICHKVGYKKGDKWPVYMLFGILFLSTISSMALPFQLGVVTNFGILTQASGGTITYQYIPYMVFALIFSLVIFFAYILLGKFIIKPDVTAFLNNTEIFEQEQFSLNKSQKVVIGLFILLVAGLLLPSFLPEGSSARILMDSIGTTGWTALVIGMGVFIRVDDKPFVDFGLMSAKGVLWDIIFMMAAIFTLSAAITSKATGIQNFILENLSPVVGGCSATLFVILALLLTTIAANLINNLAICAIFIPIAYTLSSEMSINLIALVALMIFVGNACFLLPSSSPQSAMIYNNKDWVITKDVRYLAITSTVLLAIITIILGIPMANMVL
jgi:hypothetical protein